jgi:hypothetical protein
MYVWMVWVKIAKKIKIRGVKMYDFKIGGLIVDLVK